MWYNVFSINGEIGVFKFLGKKFKELFKGKVDEEQLEKLEQLFYEADLGAQASSDLTDFVRSLYKKNSKITADEIIQEIKRELLSQLSGIEVPPYEEGKPHIILIVGVNGNGKTTTIAKLANLYRSQGKSVLVGAADTFRAAAIDQLEMWAKRLNIEIVKGKPGGDPAAVAFDAVAAAKSRGIDIVLIDTAGRLHTKNDLMHELQKVHRVAKPHETLLVLDATIGQNGVEQAATFHKFTPLSGLILTKIDGTAKGGTAIAIQKKLQLPIRYFGSGEQVSDFAPYDAQTYINNLIT